MLLREISVEILPEVISEEFCFYLDQWNTKRIVISNFNYLQQQKHEEFTQITSRCTYLALILPLIYLPNFMYVRIDALTIR